MRPKATAKKLDALAASKGLSPKLLSLWSEANGLRLSWVAAGVRGEIEILPLTAISIRSTSRATPTPIARRSISGRRGRASSITSSARRRSPSPLHAANLTVELAVGLDDCDENKLSLRARVTDVGALGVLPGTPVEFRQGDETVRCSGPEP